jgi:hypothetical protein
MDFSYTEFEGTVEHTLGTVEPYKSRVFVIGSPQATAITLIERGAAMPLYEGRRSVTLRADSVVEVSMPAEP